VILVGTFYVGVILGYGLCLISDIIWKLQHRPHYRCSRCDHKETWP